MSRTSKPKAASNRRVNVGGMAAKGKGKAVVGLSVRAFYKPAEPGVNENDLLHIVVAKPITGQTIANSIKNSFVGSGKGQAALKGMVVADVQVENLKSRLLRSGTRGTVLGRVVAVEIDRNPKYSTTDVVKNVQTRLIPGVRLGTVKVVESMEDLPGDPTGPGPK